MANKTDVLFEPLPIGRIGFRKADQEVVVVKDFSTYALMLEEFISFGAINIAIPQSAPESTTIKQMPLLLSNRIKIINDVPEIETVNRVLYDIRKEFGVQISEENNNLSFKNIRDKTLYRPITRIHEDVKKMALGFNHNLQIGLNAQHSINTIQLLRRKAKNPSARVMLAQLEATLKQYKSIDFEGITLPKETTPIELVNIFDKLINDPLYVNYSDSIAKLSNPQNRERAIIELRGLSRAISSKSYIATGWDYVSKIVKLFIGVPLPDSKAIASIINERDFPIMLNLDVAKKRVFENWKNSDYSQTPLNRNGLAISNDKIQWAPLTDSVDVLGQDGKYFSLGKAKDVIAVLKKAEALFEENKNRRSKRPTKKPGSSN